MPWYNGSYPPSYKNQPVMLREKAVEIANHLLEKGTQEGIAIATGLKRARIFFKEKQERMSTDKKYIEAFHDYEDFMNKKRLYSRAMHVFHDQTAEYNEIIDDLSVKEMEGRQKEFLRHEKNFHEIMESFEKALDTYKTTIGKLIA